MSPGQVLGFTRSSPDITAAEDETSAFSPESPTTERTSTSAPGPALIRPARSIPIQNLNSAELTLSVPLYVLVEEDANGRFTAASYDLELAGQGESEFEADRCCGKCRSRLPTSTEYFGSSN
jgi:hypothetical protein